MTGQRSSCFRGQFLDAETQVKLDRLVRFRGVNGAAKDLGVSAHKIEQLTHGGHALKSTVEQVTEALKSLCETGT